ncbi:anti-sigma factor domain-containing protein [Streptomyces sp. NPDC058417]|uniref:anti-sigma factor n=1 Tax=unclassified Streptomyces TaxID=2593676 RepID=UPI003663D1DC
MTTEEDPHLPAGAYALDALPPAEAAAFENHLAGCEACRREVDALLEITATLGGAARTVPVTGAARARTLDAVAHTRQDPVARTRQDSVARDRAVPAARRPRTRRGRAVDLALAASLAAAAGLGGVAVWQHTQADDARERAERSEQRARTSGAALTDVLTAPDAVVHAQRLDDGTAAVVVVSRSEGRAVFTADGLPALPSDKVYELWYAADSGDLRPAGLLPGDARPASRLLKGSPTDAVAVGITVEPAGGSEQPTSEPLGIIPITA